ncbi:MAG: hypothetical protein M1831_006691 [Alyxoria varia]|nr:MAG: hypothetical protein M1831_006691 [Alyxoria varia]
MASLDTLPTETRLKILNFRLLDDLETNNEMLLIDRTRKTQSAQGLPLYSILSLGRQTCPGGMKPFEKGPFLTSRKMHDECIDILGHSIAFWFDGLPRAADFHRDPDLNDEFLKSKPQLHTAIRHIKIELPPLVVGPTVERQQALFRTIRDTLPNVQTVDITLSSWVFSEKRANKLLGLWAIMLQPLAHINTIKCSESSSPRTDGLDAEKDAEPFYSAEELANRLKDEIRKVQGQPEAENVIKSEDTVIGGFLTDRLQTVSPWLMRGMPWW